MKYFINTIFVSIILISNGCADEVVVKCPDNNYMLKKISTQKITIKNEEN